jgi:hypothetical protein
MFCTNNLSEFISIVLNKYFQNDKARIRHVIGIKQ